MPDHFRDHHNQQNGALTPGSATHGFEKDFATLDARYSAKKRGCCSKRALGTACMAVGALLVIAAVAYSTVLPGVISAKIEGGVAACKEEDITKESFLDPYGPCKDCTPFYFRLNMFNVTNAEAYLTKNAKLKVREVGPYVYSRRQIKVDVHFVEDNSLLSYKTYSYHTFEPSMSCEGCKDTDQVISWDVGYINVVSQSGGEFGFLRKLGKGAPWGALLTEAEIDEVVEKNGKQMMRWVNGLNSNQPKAWNAIGDSVLGFLAGGVAAISDLDLSGFEYNGIFATRPISDWALGYPSMLAGLGLGSNYVKACNVTGGWDEKCASCKGDACLKIWAECKKCKTGKRVVEVNPILCAKIAQKHAAVYGEEAGYKFSNATCGMCTSLGLCAAPLPGAAESSGMDYSVTPPPASALGAFIQKTGCVGDKSDINEYIQFDGYRTAPLWAKLDKRRNPTLAEINAFALYGNCDAKTSNLTCSDVMGNDATATKPGGASISGFPEKVDVQASKLFLGLAKQTIGLINTGEVVDIDGVKLTRFIPPNDLLSYSAEKEAKGTGFPVDGVIPLAFARGFLAYLSYPLYLNGDKSLLEGVEITMVDGVIASHENLYDGENLKPDYYDRYQTIVDMEPGTGKTMRARKRLMASYALAPSTFKKGKPMSDLVWPKLKAEVISPAYFGEEAATIGASKLETFRGIDGLLSTLLPSLIAGCVVGVALLVGGFFYARRARRAEKSGYAFAL